MQDLCTAVVLCSVAYQVLYVAVLNCHETWHDDCIIIISYDAAEVVVDRS